MEGLVRTIFDSAFYVNKSSNSYTIVPEHFSILKNFIVTLAGNENIKDKDLEIVYVSYMFYKSVGNVIKEKKYNLFYNSIVVNHQEGPITDIHISDNTYSGKTLLNLGFIKN